VETYGFNLDKFENVLNITSKMKELNLKVMAEMHKLGVKTEREELDEKLHNLAMRGVNEQGQ
jgi:hypothetical protein